MYRPVQISVPAITPVSLTQVKAQLDIGYTEKDTQIGVLLGGAVSYLDGWTGVLGGRCLVDQTWRQDFDCFNRCLRIHMAPVIETVSVKYLDEAGAEQTVGAANYQTLEDGIGPYIRFNDAFAFPVVKNEGPAVSVTNRLGYASTGTDPDFVSTVPDALKQAILLLVRHWFDNPGAVVVGLPVQKMPIAFEMLIAPWRRTRL